MKKYLRQFLEFVSPKYGKYFPIIIKNRLKRVLIQTSNYRYLFILSPPYSGSTLLNEILSTSSNVSVNNIFDSMEGQTLPTLRKIMFDTSERWNPEYDLSWGFIKNEWLKYWDQTASYLLDKSPPNIIRAFEIEKIFNKPYFIILIRNPYVLAENLMRKNNSSCEVAAKFSIQCLKYQMHNYQKLENKILIYYEELTNNIKHEVDRIYEFLPQIKDLNINKEFNAHNQDNKKSKIKDYNKNSFQRLSKDQLDTINRIFSTELDILKYFKYDLITQ